MTITWGNGYVDYRSNRVYYFENNGVVWYDAANGIARDGWQAELEPYEGPNQVGYQLEKQE